MEQIHRLIIIGNGFDLAHGLKTSFKDFIEDYFSNALNYFHKHNYYSDLLFSIKFQNKYNAFPHGKALIEPHESIQLIAEYRYNNLYNSEFTSLLLGNIFKKINTVNWVDIEIEYFNILKDLHAKKNSEKNQIISDLNEQLDFLREQLCTYLQKVQDSSVNNYNTTELVQKFCEVIEPYELVTISIPTSVVPESLYFLNFNYTRTIAPYVTICQDKIYSNFNYIHGDLAKIEGKPIFGFGDELDKNYLEFEDEGNNDLFKHIKSFEYLQTQNFYQLTRFIEANKFQVHIYGHSCGVSDRTMLSQIFENKNCLSVKIFYHKIDDNTNDFTDKTYEISRHFRDKTMLRKKLIPFELSSPMPQPRCDEEQNEH